VRAMSEGDEEAPPSAHDEEAPPSAPAVPVREALAIAVGVTVAASAVLAYAFDPVRAGQVSMLWAIGALYAVLAVVAVLRLRKRGELLARFRPARGDITMGALTAGLLYGAGRIVLLLVAAHGSQREPWIMRLYLQIGDPVATGRWLVGASVFAVAALEEIVWRGLVMRTLEDSLGPRRALIYSALLCAAAHAPTAYLLRDPMAGLNPVVMFAAFVCSVAWGAMLQRSGRLLPALLSHALFSWFVIEYPMWRL
jgi:uncharacterized protein